MKDKKMLAALTTAALVAVLALAGCGGSQATSSTAAESSSTAATASASASTSTAAESSSTQAADSSAATTEATSAADAYIGEDAAMEIALKDAGIAKADAMELEAELDTDDNPIHYDVEFKAGGMEYDYDIDAATGDILDSSSEVDD